ncbi:MAG: histidine triad nucleotide-binding protein [Gammaproteobacteria bacterium]|nr:histidine triad nucleotide-binding protein [Gammaproteobacteria bacterium]
MASGDIPGDIIYEDEDVVAFNDVNPQAPVHCLIIPREHVPTLNELDGVHAELMGKLFLTAGRIARDMGFAETGYRTVINCNSMAGQTVFHIHLHLLAGRPMSWPPG